MMRIAIAGNPNCGKTTLFNLLTGARQRTGNWPGVTVEQKSGIYRDVEGEIEVVDLPGVYTLRPIPGMEDQSLDEKLARDAIVREDFDVVVNIVDATNLERNLYLTSQLLETGKPAVVALNMMDAAKKAGLKVDPEALSRHLGVPVVPLVAARGEGLKELIGAVRAAAGSRPRGARIPYPAAVERLAEDLEKVIDYTAHKEHVSRRWLAIRLIEGDDLALKLAGEETAGVLRHRLPKLRQELGEEPDLVIAEARYAFAHEAAHAAIHRLGVATASTSDAIDRIVLHKIFGPLVFLAAIYLMFMLTINVGGAFIDFFGILARTIFVDGSRALLAAIGLPEWLIVIVSDGFGAGIEIVATFIPIIGALFLILSFLEDSGYMVRAAFLMDRLMRAIGLPGKAFVPLIVGFGCNVPAVMATRTLESERERKLTILMNPFMSCGARLPVYALFVAAFFPTNGQNIVFLLYLIGIAAAVLTGLVMKRTLLHGESDGFMMELPTYHRPTLKGVLLRTWDRVRLFLKEAGQVIIVMVAIINVLNSIGTDGSFGNEDTEHSVLSVISQQLTPAFAPMGLHEDNWPATVGIFSGVLAKEVVVGTLDTLYSRLANEDAGVAQTEQVFDFWAAIRASAATVPANLAALGDAFRDPIGLDVGEIGDAGAAAEAQAVDVSTFGAMATRFDGQAGAFAYMLFILLYSPCVATIGAIAREAGKPWAAFVVAWTTVLAYVVASVFYQVATFMQHPGPSALLIGLMLALVAAVLAGLMRWGRAGRAVAAGADA